MLGIDVGLLINPGTAAMRPELRVTMRNECFQNEDISQERVTDITMRTMT